jgi:hypothetical protein
MGNQTYPQMPYTSITQEEYESYVGKLKPVDLSCLYEGNVQEAIGERYCTTDTCDIKIENASVVKK